MGYEFLLTHCFACEQPFTCNLELVPSVKDENGVRQPLCKTCVESVIATQKERGLPQWAPPLPGAYEPQEVPY